MNSLLHKRAPVATKVQDAVEDPAISAAVTAQRPHVGAEKAQRVSAPDDAEEAFLETRERYNMKAPDRRQSQSHAFEETLTFGEVLALARSARDELFVTALSIANGESKPISELIREILGSEAES